MTEECMHQNAKRILFSSAVEQNDADDRDDDDDDHDDDDDDRRDGCTFDDDQDDDDEDDDDNHMDADGSRCMLMMMWLVADQDSSGQHPWEREGQDHQCNDDSLTLNSPRCREDSKQRV